MSKYRYLFAYFTGESEDGEQVYFSVSEDGMRWKDINDGKPVLKNTIGSLGVRDPFLFYSVIDGNYYILGTDLKISSGIDWDFAKNEGSTQIIIWKSKDLEHWSKPWAFPVNIEGAGCAWAPEAIFDKNKDAYMVFWASSVGVSDGKNKKLIIYYAYTKDFYNFTESKKYMEFEYDVIDATIIEYEGLYYRFYKDENKKNIKVDCCSNLHGKFREINSSTLENFKGVEGPIVYKLEKPKGWCLLIDQYVENKGYLPLYCKELMKCDFTNISAEKYNLGTVRKRHGSVIRLNEEKLDKIISHTDTSNKINKNKNL